LTNSNPTNLCALPKCEQDAIEADKLAWFEAHKMIKDLKRWQIVRHLDGLPADDRRDLANRLNTIKQRNKRENNA